MTEIVDKAAVEAQEALQKWLDHHMKTMVNNWVNEETIELRFPEKHLPMELKLPATVTISIRLGRHPRICSSK